MEAEQRAELEVESRVTIALEGFAEYGIGEDQVEDDEEQAR